MNETTDLYKLESQYYMKCNLPTTIFWASTAADVAAAMYALRSTIIAHTFATLLLTN
jgi:uncharacterized protein involved in propanediol utilization